MTRSQNPGTLILVDLDNLVIGWFNKHKQEGTLPTFGQSKSPRGPWLVADRETDEVSHASAEPKTVVVLAVNRSTVTKHHLSMKYLHRLASALVRWTGASPRFDIEVVLTLAMPQSADVALERLTRDAPRLGTAINYRTLWLVSQDRGLALGLEKSLGCSRPDIWNREECAVRRWKRRKPCKRTFSSRPYAVAAPSAPAHAWSMRIVQASHAAWAKSRRAQLPPVDLVGMANVTKRLPGLLTQIGATSATVRGIGRLSQMVWHGMPPEIGECAPSDGLEMSGENASTELVGSVSASHVGIGAAFVDTVEATVSTCLPWHVLETFGQIRPKLRERPKKRGYIDDCSLLREMTEGKRYGRPSVVKVFYRGSALKVEVDKKFGEDVLNWWWLPREQVRKIRSSIYIPDVSKELTIAFSGSCTVRASVSKFEDQLVLRAVTPSSRGVVDLAKPISGSELGVGYRGNEKVLVLALDARIEGDVECQPIQDIPQVELERRLPALATELYDLRKFPILVPVCQKPRAASVTAAGREATRHDPS